MTRIYSVKPTENGVSVKPVTVDGELSDGYSSVTSVQVGKKTILYAFDKTKKTTDVYELSGKSDSLKKVVAGSDEMKLFPWDIVKSFVLGNRPYLLTYESKNGTMGFYEVQDDYSLSKPYTFINRRDWPTKNFSEVTPFVSLGLVYVMGYDIDSGTVGIYSLNVTASNPSGAPALIMLNVWYHHWAKGWTDFAFFTLGRSNFFFKINKMKLNVNIDHIQDDPSRGTTEIGSWLQDLMPNAKDITLDVTIPWTNGEIYLGTYDGQTHKVDVYHIHPDCESWTLQDSVAAAESTQMISYRMGDTSYILLYA
ncbi:MAG: hypothetical protein NTW29_17550 [Bacteroidetes bacterium]|nr:hypothetical protein [Bacteroidota bacterium]